jgi:alpha-tubulin suppressor-like RCC1 family protein
MKKQILKLAPSLVLILVSMSSSAQRIAAGGWHSVVVCNDSTVKAFGENATGQLGNGLNTDSNIPVVVNGLSGVTAVSAGGDQLEAHSMALKSDGTVWAWGSNLYGGLGNGSLTNTTTPVQAIGLTNMKAISAGGWHSAALKSDGTLWTWGWNTDGQLGDGTTVDKSTPIQVPGLTNVTAVAAGTYHVLALRSDSTVWAWGDNINGQIGNGTTTDQTLPVQVVGLTNVVKICAGRFFSLAIKSDGTVWTWGQNLYGQLGDGTVIDSPVPIQVNSLSNITSVAAIGAFHCLVMKSDSTIWSWGRNTYGNLGDNTVANSNVPVQMIGISASKGIACGTNFSILYKGDGTFWGCGRNASGQLGDSTFLQHNVATQSLGVCPILQDQFIATMSNNIELDGLKIYPNPTSGIVIIENSIDANNSIKSIEVNSINGQTVYSKLERNGNGQKVIVDMHSQPSGIYILKIKVGDSMVYKKLIKE